MSRYLFLIVVGMLLTFSSLLRAQDSGSRYNKEFVFPLSMRNLSIGVSPAIWQEFMTHVHKDVDLSVTLPPIHVAFERCAWDMDNAGSIGWGGSLSYGRYEYHYHGGNGHGGDVVNVRAGMIQGLVGPSYHYTIKTRLEAYTRVMLGVGVTGFKSDKDGANQDWNGKFIWNGVAGMRYFFSNTLGLYLEGGYTSGYVNAGITHRW